LCCARVVVDVLGQHVRFSCLADARLASSASARGGSSPSAEPARRLTRHGPDAQGRDR
jgi:hypothetical protein